MKKISILTLVLLFLSSLCLAEENNNSKHDNHNQQKSVLFQSGSIDPNGILLSVSVEGMVCDFCAQAIEKVFMKKKEVAGITIDLDNQNVTIALKENNDIDNKILEKLFLNAGYNITSIDRNKF
mgnify:FL=1